MSSPTAAFTQVPRTSSPYEDILKWLDANKTKVSGNTVGAVVFFILDEVETAKDSGLTVAIIRVIVNAWAAREGIRLLDLKSVPPPAKTQGSPLISKFEDLYKKADKGVDFKLLTNNSLSISGLTGERAFPSGLSIDWNAKPSLEVTGTVKYDAWSVDGGTKKVALNYAPSQLWKFSVSRSHEGSYSFSARHRGIHAQLSADNTQYLFRLSFPNDRMPVRTMDLLDPTTGLPAIHPVTRKPLAQSDVRQAVHEALAAADTALLAIRELESADTLEELVDAGSDIGKGVSKVGKVPSTIKKAKAKTQLQFGIEVSTPRVRTPSSGPEVKFILRWDL